MYTHAVLFICSDRDVAKWNVGNEIADRRRQIFWELFTLDSWHVSLISVLRGARRVGYPADGCFIYFFSSFFPFAKNIANGKPCSYVLKYIDCKEPEYNARVTTKEGRVERSCESLALPPAQIPDSMYHSHYNPHSPCQITNIYIYILVFAFALCIRRKSDR